MTDHPVISARSWVMVATLGMVWGSTFLVIELALAGGIGPAWLAASRILFASVLMLGVQAIRRAPLFLEEAGPRHWGLLTVIALLSSAIPFNLLSWGQLHVTSGFAGVSMATVALMVLPMAHFLVTGERLSWRKVVGFVVGFAGVCVLIGGQAFDSTGAAMEAWGRLACLGAAACYAVSSVLMRRLPPVDPVNLAGVLLGIGALAAVPAALWQEGLPPTLPGQTLFWIALLGLVPTAGANILRVLLIRRSGPTFMSITNYIVPVWSVLAGWAVLAEPLPPSLLWALLLILGGVGLTQYGALSRLFGRRSASASA